MAKRIRLDYVLKLTFIYKLIHFKSFQSPYIHFKSFQSSYLGQPIKWLQEQYNYTIACIVLVITINQNISAIPISRRKSELCSFYLSSIHSSLSVCHLLLLLYRSRLLWKRIFQEGHLQP